MNEPLAYLNGQFIPNKQCVLPIYDAGIVLGAAVTDLLRTFRGRPFAAKEHVRRFFESARYAYIDLGMSEAEMLAIVERLITHNIVAWGGREVALVFYATVGQFPVYAGAAGMAGEMHATVCLHCFPLPLQLWKRAIAEGVHVVTPAQRHIHPATLNSKIKHRNRLHMWIGDQQAKLADPKAIGLYLDHDGNITETGGSNFLILKDGTIFSPRCNNILWGVTLETVRRLSGPLGLQFAERDLQIHDVVNADEAWLCTTPYFLAAAVKINGIPIASGRPGPVWRRLMDTFSAEVGVDVAQQILDSP
ncbi:MAG: aminotransferase class IV [Verrucomicrobiia bacterium]|jgi:branched-subunit amino acid aminotransferase/4-amino-4-deoxychorismate lyase